MLRGELQRLALVDHRMSQLVAENERLLQFVNEGQDPGGSGVVNRHLSTEPASGNAADADGGNVNDSVRAHARTADTAAVARQMQAVVELMQETLGDLTFARAELETKRHVPRRRPRRSLESEDEDEDEMGYRWQGAVVQHSVLDVDLPAGDEIVAEGQKKASAAGLGGADDDSRVEYNHHHDDGSDSDDDWDVPER